MKTEQNVNEKFVFQLHQLSLVSSGEQDLMQSEARELHKKYASISAILK